VKLEDPITAASAIPGCVNKEYNAARIWQRNYYDRIIRNDGELDAIRNYIETNPRNWMDDDENLMIGK
jgi:REP element-mobilizing transposase RayT